MTTIVLLAFCLPPQAPTPPARFATSGRSVTAVAVGLPPQAPDPPVRAGRCGVVGCDCGCLETGVCSCARPDLSPPAPATFPVRVVPVQAFRPFATYRQLGPAPRASGYGVLSGACAGGG